jgi:hypothetical protein
MAGPGFPQEIAMTANTVRMPRVLRAQLVEAEIRE